MACEEKVIGGGGGGDVQDGEVPFPAETIDHILKCPNAKNVCQKWDSNPRPQKWTAT